MVVVSAASLGAWWLVLGMVIQAYEYIANPSEAYVLRKSMKVFVFVYISSLLSGSGALLSRTPYCI